MEVSLEIKVYSTPTCPFCIEAKKYFRNKNIEFEDIDVSFDPHKADEMIKLSGQMGVPVIVIGDQVIVGFVEDEIEEALKNEKK